MSQSHRRKARVDDNQKNIVEALEKIPGVTVEKDHDDIFVGYKGVNYWFEIKNPDCVLVSTGKISEKKIRNSQKKIRERWAGQYDIVYSLGHILAILKIGV